ncbi:glycoside hydrolase family 15 protein [Aureimonas frigidaquae]|uniref:Glucan 1,4-alpha-glucosidase n=1 Tax=Aureimonas frigidaquae TaxID=424757 RepID=A0A0P0Z105_9HYPH|nr:glycoside hydrolase family 15 protein [Aureimonas frigidaquae]BAT27557.1 glucan 1,4-alpha-glucosidase [Aureimonas frigidaquae]
MSVDEAPGRPGIVATWSSSDKDMVTTSLGMARIWATLGHGILNEVYWPSTGRPQIRDLGFIVVDGHGTWTEVKRAENYLFSMPKPYVPLSQVVHEGPGYRLVLEVLPHPLRDTLLIKYALSGEGARLYALLAPHLDDAQDNTAEAGEDLAAHRPGTALCLRADKGFSRTSAGFVGASDGWTDFSRNGSMQWTYGRAEGGNVGLMGELASNSGFLALGFAETPEGARTLSRSSLADDYDETRAIFVKGWEDWATRLKLPYAAPELTEAAERSAMVIKVHRDRTFAGAVVASLSVPWGSSHDDAGGYHLVWTRDTVEAALALICVGQFEDAGRTLDYLIGTQAADGSWAQNYYPDGRGYWSGRQLDEVALPVILAAKLGAVGHLTHSQPEEDMVRKAVRFIACNGPMSDQDRWEENSGASPFTLAAMICALVAGAAYFSGAERDYVLSLADCWNERIEDWTYVQNGDLGRELGLDGYYIRLSPRAADGGIDGIVSRRNVLHGEIPARNLIGLEFLTLVRMGLRSPDDPRIVGTVRLIDRVLRAETPSGPAYYRYNGDGYGEHADGRPFDGTGIGRLWPLLSGERGHYAALSGEDPGPYLDAMIRMVGRGGLIPEQVWDSDPIAERGLWPGKPSGSAMPLVWAHGELIKLLTTRATGTPVERLLDVKDRYHGQPPRAAVWHWRIGSPFAALPAGRGLIVEAATPFRLHFGFDGWQGPADLTAEPNGLGMFLVRFDAPMLAGHSRLDFTFYDVAAERWSGVDHAIALG